MRQIPAKEQHIDQVSYRHHSMLFMSADEFYSSEELSSPTLPSLFQVIQSIPVEEIHSFYQGQVSIIPTTGFYAVFSSSCHIHSDTGESKDADTFIYFRLLQDGSIRTLVFSEQQGEWIKYQKVDWKMDNDALPVDVRHTDKLVSIKSTGDLAGDLLNGMDLFTTTDMTNH